MGDCVLELQEVTKRYGKKTVISQVSFQVRAGEIVALVGPNGAGKTTLLRMITNLVFPTQGKISVMGIPVEKRKQALKYMAAMIEQPALYEGMSGWQNAMIYGTLKKIPKNEIRERLERAGLSDSLKKKVKRYSLGMRQRLGLAVCLMQKPKLLLLDEPTNGMDPQGIFELRDWLLEEKKTGTALLISSHMLSEVQKVADRVLFIKAGKLVLDSAKGDGEDLEMKYKEIYEK